MRLTVNENEFLLIQKALMSQTKDRNEYIRLLQTLSQQYEKSKNPSERKVNATKKATAQRTKDVKLKIQKAINMMHLEGKKLSVHAISIEAGVSYNTVKKYYKS